MYERHQEVSTDGFDAYDACAVDPPSQRRARDTASAEADLPLPPPLPPPFPCTSTARPRAGTYLPRTWDRTPSGAQLRSHSRHRYLYTGTPPASREGGPSRTRRNSSFGEVPRGASQVSSTVAGGDGAASSIHEKEDSPARRRRKETHCHSFHGSRDQSFRERKERTTSRSLSPATEALVHPMGFRFFADGYPIRCLADGTCVRRQSKSRFLSYLTNNTNESLLLHPTTSSSSLGVAPSLPLTSLRGNGLSPERGADHSFPPGAPLSSAFPSHTTTMAIVPPSSFLFSSTPRAGDGEEGWEAKGRAEWVGETGQEKREGEGRRRPPRSRSSEKSIHSTGPKPRTPATAAQGQRPVPLPMEAEREGIGEEEQEAVRRNRQKGSSRRRRLGKELSLPVRGGRPGGTTTTTTRAATPATPRTTQPPHLASSLRPRPSSGAPFSSSSATPSRTSPHPSRGAPGVGPRRPQRAVGTTTKKKKKPPQLAADPSSSSLAPPPSSLRPSSILLSPSASRSPLLRPSSHGGKGIGKGGKDVSPHKQDAGRPATGMYVTFSSSPSSPSFPVRDETASPDIIIFQGNGAHGISHASVLPSTPRATAAAAAAVPPPSHPTRSRTPSAVATPHGLGPLPVPTGEEGTSSGRVERKGGRDSARAAGSSRSVPRATLLANPSFASSFSTPFSHHPPYPSPPPPSFSSSFMGGGGGNDKMQDVQEEEVAPPPPRSTSCASSSSSSIFSFRPPRLYARTPTPMSKRGTGAEDLDGASSSSTNFSETAFQQLRFQLYAFLLREGPPIDMALDAYRRARYLSVETIDHALECAATAAAFYDRLRAWQQRVARKCGGGGRVHHHTLNTLSSSASPAAFHTSGGGDGGVHQAARVVVGSIVDTPLGGGTPKEREAATCPSSHSHPATSRTPLDTPSLSTEASKRTEEKEKKRQRKAFQRIKIMEMLSVFLYDCRLFHRKIQFLVECWDYPSPTTTVEAQRRRVRLGRSLTRDSQGLSRGRNSSHPISRPPFPSPPPLHHGALPGGTRSMPWNTSADTPQLPTSTGPRKGGRAREGEEGHQDPPVGEASTGDEDITTTRYFPLAPSLSSSSSAAPFFSGQSPTGDPCTSLWTPCRIRSHTRWYHGKMFAASSSTHPTTAMRRGEDGRYPLRDGGSDAWNTVRKNNKQKPTLAVSSAS